MKPGARRTSQKNSGEETPTTARRAIAEAFFKDLRPARLLSGAMEFMNKRLVIDTARGGYGLLIVVASSLQSVFLLVVRLYWGWQFFLTGKGKLTHIEKVTGFFRDLGIPLPALNAHLVGTTECVCGLCLLLGLASRLTTLPLIFITIMAYLTAQREALQSIFSDPDKFTSADPFLFLLAALLVFLFGPGGISVDGLVKWRLGRRKTKTTQSTDNALA